MNQKESNRLRQQKYREANKEKVSIYYKNYREANKEKIKQNNITNIESITKSKKKWIDNNQDVIKKYHDEYRKNNPNKHKKWVDSNKVKVTEYQQKYREANKEKRNKNNKKRRLNDNNYRLISNIRASIRKAFIKNNCKKKSKTIDIICCSLDDFRLFIESKFLPWMNWENYGLYNGELNYGWDLDHIIPISSAKTEADVIKLSHYTNYQPLCSKVNRDIKKDL